MSEDITEFLERMKARFGKSGRGQGRALGLEFVEGSLGEIKLRLPYSDKIIGNPCTGVIHGGTITTLMDSCCGMAVFTVLRGKIIAPTLDLRIDYMHAAEPGKPVYGHARAYHCTENVIFCEAKAYQEDPHHLVARCAATFMKLDMNNVDLSGIPEEARARFQR